jgi:hypothetical protein
MHKIARLPEEKRTELFRETAAKNMKLLPSEEIDR